MAVVRPVVLCGGAGARLWPLSTPDRPKPYLALTGPQSLFQQTLRRVSDRSLYEPPLVVAAHRHRFLAGEQMTAVGATGTILLEPVARGTALAAAAAALVVSEDDPATLLLILPADHHVPDSLAFALAVRRAVPAAEDGALVLFGVTPTEPATGYGYICKGAALGDAFAVEAFVEKPHADDARRLCEAGALWNSGIFLMRADRLLSELEEHEPAIVAAARTCVDTARRDADFIRLTQPPLEPLPVRSLDHAVMERTRSAVVLEADFPWSDIGAWSAVQALGEADAAGNVVVGDAQVIDSHGVYARSDGPPLAVVGMTDVIVIAGREGVLVAARGAEQSVRSIGEAARASPALGPA